MKSLLLISYLLFISTSNLNSLELSKDAIVPDGSSSPLRLDRQKLGHITWKVLHSFAAAYPIEPSVEAKFAWRSLIFAFTQLYPCEECRGHFKKMIDKHPPVDTNRHDVVMYVCQLHNIVNERLNKPIFDCSKAFDFWGGDCGCTGSDSSDSSSSEGSSESSSGSDSQSEEEEHEGSDISSPEAEQPEEQDIEA